MGTKAAHITGLPRTMGCWLSMVINAHSKEHGQYSTIEGYHELLTKVESIVEYEAVLYNPYVPLVVDCSSVVNYRAGDKLVVVCRPREEVLESLYKLPLFRRVHIEVVRKQMDILLANLDKTVEAFTTNPYYVKDLLEIDFFELHTREGVARVLAHIGITPNPTVITQWLELNIQAQYMNTITYAEFLAKGEKVAALLQEAKDDNSNYH